MRIFRGYRARGARAPHIWVQIRVIIPKYAHISLFIPYIRVLYGLEDPAKLGLTLDFRVFLHFAEQLKGLLSYEIAGTVLYV